MDIQVYDKMQDPLAAIEKLGVMFAKSGMFGCDRTEQGQVLATICLCEKKSPVQISRTYHIIDGKLSKKALAALAEFRQRGGKHKWIVTGEGQPDNDSRYAEGEFTWEGNTIRVKYSIVDARRSGVIRNGSAWTKSPANMLRARVISNAIGMLAPEIYSGDDDESLSAPQELNIAAVKPTADERRGPPFIPDLSATPVTVDIPTHPDNPVQATAVIDPTAPPLSNDEAESLAVAIGVENVSAATAYLIRRGWITDEQAKTGEGFRYISRENLGKINGNINGFVNAINRPAK